jgi:hypothetical protein
MHSTASTDRISGLNLASSSVQIFTSLPDFVRTERVTVAFMLSIM